MGEIMTAAQDDAQAQAAEAAAAPQLFYDSAAYEFPEHATHVVGYSSGDFAYDVVKPHAPPLGQLYPAVHWITVLGGSHNWRARILDYEQYNRAYEHQGSARDWAEARITRELAAVLYCDRANLHRARAEVGPVIWRELLFWIPTLDGTFWGPSALSFDIADNWGVYVPAARIWGTQGKDAQQSGGNWDTSALYGSW
jgi:hypothetical protein